MHYRFLIIIAALCLFLNTAPAWTGDDGVPLSGFFALCAHGSAQEVSQALLQDNNPNQTDPAHGDITPLQLAGGNNPDPEVITLLLQAGAHIDVQGKTYKRTALHLAVLFNSNPVPIIKALSAGQPDFSLEDSRHNTALSYAIAGKLEGNAFSGIPRDEVILALLESGAGLYDGPPPNADFNYNAMAAYLGAFHRNSRAPSYAVLEAMLKAGADINALTPKNAGQEGTILNMAVAYNNGQPRLIKLLLDNGADPNKPDEEMATPLLVAARNQDLAAIYELLAAGALVNIANQRGNTPLHEAILWNDGTRPENLKDVVELLLQTGADANASNHFGQTPLHLFPEFIPSYIGHEQALALQPVIRLLLDAGADINAPDNNGYTPLFSLTGRLNFPISILRLLVMMGADINARNINGNTPLLLYSHPLSIMETQGEIKSAHMQQSILDHIEVFLELGADGAIRNKDDMRAIDYIGPHLKDALADSPWSYKLLTN